MGIQILVLGAEDSRGGAGIASTKIVHCLRGSQETLTSYWVRRKFDQESGAAEVRGNRLPRRLLSAMVKMVLKVASRGSWPYLSAGVIPWGIVRKINSSPADVVNLHWLGDKGLSVREIGRVRKPIVWTLHDEWPFRGVHHYEPEPGTPDMLQFLEGWLIENKRKCWLASGQKFYAIAPSAWMKSQLLDSSFGPDARVEVIPYPLDTEFWSPGSLLASRKNLAVDPHLFTVLFVGDTRDRRKGFSKLEAAVRTHNQNACHDDAAKIVQLLVIGKHEPPRCSDSKYLRYLGEMDSVGVREAHRAADLVVIPSEADNLPQVAMEAQSVGKPVIATNVGGLPDTIIDGTTGFLISPSEVTADLIRLFRSFTENRAYLAGVGQLATKRAVTLWSPGVIATMHQNFFKQVINEATQDR